MVTPTEQGLSYDFGNATKHNDKLKETADVKKPALTFIPGRRVISGRLWLPARRGMYLSTFSLSRETTL